MCQHLHMDTAVTGSHGWSSLACLLLTWGEIHIKMPIEIQNYKWEQSIGRNRYGIRLQEGIQGILSAQGKAGNSYRAAYELHCRSRQGRPQHSGRRIPGSNGYALWRRFHHKDEQKWQPLHRRIFWLCGASIRGFLVAGRNRRRRLCT